MSATTVRWALIGQPSTSALRVATVPRDLRPQPPAPRAAMATHRACGMLHHVLNATLANTAMIQVPCVVLKIQVLNMF